MKTGTAILIVAGGVGALVLYHMRRQVSTTTAQNNQASGPRLPSLPALPSLPSLPTFPGMPASGSGAIPNAPAGTAASGPVVPSTPAGLFDTMWSRGR